MIKIIRAIGVSLIAAFTVAAHSQEGVGEKIKPYMIDLAGFQIKGVGRVKGKIEIVGVSKGRSYGVTILQTQFFKASGGEVLKLTGEQGLKALRPGIKLDIQGLMNPATARITAATVTIR